MRGGILADEMGLGKTIMVASLIHTTTPYNAPPSDDEASDRESGDDDSEADSKPRTSTKVPVAKPGQTQSKLRQFAAGSSTAVDKGKGKAKAKKNGATATLVVAPMTLLSQWCDELERSSKDGMQVLLYYGSNRSNLQAEIEGGIEVVVTR